MSKRSLLRVVAALLVSALSIYSLSIFKSGPRAAADFECAAQSDPRTVSIDVASGETGSEIARELFDKEVTASAEVFFRLAVADPKAQLIAPGVHIIDTQICAEQARMILPQNMYTEWYWSGSLYAFARICSLRLKKDTQKETRDIADMIYKLAEKNFPVSWKALMCKE